MIIFTRPEILQGDTFKLFAINTLTSVAYSFVLPIMSLFLISELKAAPALIGLFTVSVALGGIVANQTAGKFIDRGIDAKKLLLMGLAALISTGVLFAHIQHFWQAVLVGLLIYSIGNTCIPILLSMIRHHADKSTLSATKLNAQMRSGVSLVWILGPAMAFSLVGQFGFSATYLSCAAIASIAFVATLIFLPSFKHTKSTATQLSENSAPIHLKFWLLALVVFFGNFANGLYFTAMPLVVTQELMLPEHQVGILMGITAALEIPAMLLAPRLSQQFGRFKIFTTAFALGLAYYSLLQLADSLALLILLQLLNGLFFGLFIGLGISILQDELPSRIGFASALHTNAMRVGSMFGSSAGGILAQFFGFQRALLGSLAGIGIALIILFGIQIIFKNRLADT